MEKSSKQTRLDYKNNKKEWSKNFKSGMVNRRNAFISITSALHKQIKVTLPPKVTVPISLNIGETINFDF